MINNKTHSSPADPRLRSILTTVSVFILLAVVIGLIYSNTFGVSFVFDDDGSIVSNELVHVYNLSQVSFLRLKEIFKVGRSIGQISFAFNFYMGRLDVFGYHLFNLIIHILASVSVYLFIRATMDLSGSDRARSERIAVITSLLFAVHPVQTQSVTYIVQRETSMATLFYLWGLLAYIQARTSGRKNYFVLTFLFFLLAAGTKQTAAIFPFVLMGYEVCFFQENKIEWLKKNRFFLGCAILSPLALGFLYTGPHMISWFSERYAERSFTLIERVLTQQRVLMHYLSLLIFPAPSRLNLDYDFPVSGGLTLPTVISALFIVVALLIMVRLVRSKPLISFIIFWFYANLFIESSVLALEMVYEHRLYLPSIGIFLLFALMVEDNLLRYPMRRYWGVAGLVVLGIILCVFTFKRNEVWRDDMTLWTDATRKSPNKSRPHNNLGNAYLSRNDPQRAIEHHQIAISLDPKNHDAHYNLANDYLRINRLNESIGFYKKAVELKPDYAKAYANLGTVYNNMGRYDEAIEQALLALKHRPYYVDVYYNMANACFYKKDYPAAEKYYQHVISTKPDHDMAYNNLGGVYMLLDKPIEAIGYFQSAISYGPHAPDYRNNLGMAYKKAGKLQQAINTYSLAIRMKPDYFEPYYNMAQALVQQRKIEEALQILTSYLRIDPNHVRTHMFLGLILADYSQEKDKAIQLLEKAIQLGPKSTDNDKIREKINLIKENRQAEPVKP